ncbi:extracellular solute-binding protein [Amorphus sp. MBR-141]
MRRGLNSTVVAIAVSGMAFPAPSFANDEASSPPLVVACLDVGHAVAACRAGAQSWSEKSGRPVRVVVGSLENGAALDQYEALLSVESRALDVVQLPLAALPRFSGDLLDLGGASTGGSDAHVAGSGPLPAVEAPAQQRGRKIAAPVFLSVGQWFYRTDLGLAGPPTRWDEVADIVNAVRTAQARETQEDIWGMVFAGAPGEALTASFLEWMAGGSRSVQEETDDPVTHALERANQWVGSVVPPDISDYQEPDALALFVAGNSALIRGWTHDGPMVRADESAIKDKVAAAPLPAGGDGIVHAAMTAFYLGVSRHSTQAEAARDLVSYMTGVAQQRAAAETFGQPPTIGALYDDSALVALHVDLGIVADSLEGAFLIATPGGQKPTDEETISSVVSDMLAGVISPEKASADLKDAFAGERPRRGF